MTREVYEKNQVPPPHPGQLPAHLRHQADSEHGSTLTKVSIEDHTRRPAKKSRLLEPRVSLVQPSPRLDLLYAPLDRQVSLADEPVPSSLELPLILESKDVHLVLDPRNDQALRLLVSLVRQSSLLPPAVYPSITYIDTSRLSIPTLHLASQLGETRSDTTSPFTRCLKRYLERRNTRPEKEVSGSSVKMKDVIGQLPTSLSRTSRHLILITRIVNRRYMKPKRSRHLSTRLPRMERSTFPKRQRKPKRVQPRTRKRVEST